MNEESKYTEIDMDEYILGIEKKDIIVPEELEQRIKRRIAKTGTKKYYFLKIIASVAIFLLILAGTIKWVPGAEAFAKTIPGLKIAVSWLEGDKGVKGAEKHGYKPVSGITITEKGYKLTIFNVSFDEDRLLMSAHVTGPNRKGNFLSVIFGGMKKIESVRVSLKDFKDNTNIETSTANSHSMLGQDPKRFDEIVASNMDSEEKEDNSADENLEKTFRSGEAGEFMKKKADYLTIDVRVYGSKVIGHNKYGTQRELLHVFKDVKIPFDYSMVKKSLVFLQNESIDFNKSNLKIEKISAKKLVINPTSMKLTLGIKAKQGSFINSFLNPYLKDENGKVYETNKSWNILYGNDGTYISFAPSAFFDSLPKKMYFCFDGLGMWDFNTGKSIKIDMRNGHFPIVYEYNKNMKITIYKAEYKNGQLNLDVNMPGDDPFKGLHQGMDFIIKGNEDKYGGSGSGKIGIISKISMKADKREIYELEVRSCDYVVKTKGEIPLDLKKTTD